MKQQIIPQFNIYSVDCKPVEMSVGDTRRIEFTQSCILYRFYDIEESHALTLYMMVKNAYATGNGFFGNVANAVHAYCKACHINEPWGSQIWK